jgi:hypothetical protein
MKKLLLIWLAIVLSGCTTIETEPPATEIVVEKTTEPKIETVESSPVPATVERNTPPATVERNTPTKESLNHLDLLNQLLFETSTRKEAQEILTKIETSRDTRFVASLIDVMRYQRGLIADIGHTLNTLTGQDLPPDWGEWVEWAGKHPEIESFDGYVGFKANLFAQIDPDFLRFVHEDVKIAPESRPEEIVWGGVRVDGIPALDNPKMIDPAEATYLIPHERVFGVSINGDTRAYPARFLDWHEMFNDIVGGEPVSLAY